MPAQVGLRGEAAVIVDQSNTASALGSGGVPAFGTPALVQVMERAAVNALRNHLGDNEDTVGSHISVRHLAPTPIGKRVRAEATVTAVEGRRITFAVSAFDFSGQIGEGTHERVIIDHDQFVWKLAARNA
ncbi:MAG: thioesterase family protein [Candidatus Marsarchaeota archaeon]|nr:thioesterase family protein [Candidatus Marsarchaeota archaeon]